MSVSFEKCSNQVLVATDRMQNVKSVSLKIRVGVGGCYETSDQRGISHFIEHMAFKGTTTKSKMDIASKLDELGGHFNAYTSKESTAYHCTVPSEYVEEAFDILADIILNPTYDEAEIELERGVIIQEIGMYEDDPQDKLSEEYYKTCFKDQAFGDSILGPIENIKKFHKQNFLDYIARFYHNDNMIVGAAGDIEFSKLKALTEKYFNNESSKAPTAEQNGHCTIPRFTPGECRINKPDLEQVQILLGFPGVPKDTEMNHLKHEIAASILGGGMSSKLFQEIRENRGLAYSVSSWHSSYGACGMFSIYGGVQPEKSNEFITESINEMKKMIDYVTTQDLERVKKQLRCSIIVGNDGTKSRTNQLIYSLSTYKKYVHMDEILAKINSINLNDIREVISSTLNSRNSVISSIGKLDKNVMSKNEFDTLLNQQTITTN